MELVNKRVNSLAGEIEDKTGNYLFVLFKLIHQSQLMLKHCNVTLLKIKNWYKID